MTDTIQHQDTILGYTLTRKIGSGGYGDVWEAEAPGGLKKAIKIIHGFHDEKRAQSELKALDRIKEARHPFILSLERFEIVNSKLVVVSELADKSLAELVNEYIDQGGTGVPRDELLGYMRDAADALDYLYQNLGLQHLDVKPENILLVAGHAKVADFGLVKDIRETSQSLMSGMTPAYAAPEMFDGRPGTTSDQYSLAAVYQEMLTTVRPFPGSTPAQLAAQHMNGKPDLRMLPISDQPIVARALSKEPHDRYKTCKQFVEQLSNRKTRKRVIKSRANVRQSLDTGGETVVFQDTKSKQHTELFSNSGLTFNSVDLESFDAPECDPSAACFQPTLVIGIGNSASRVIQKIKNRMVARHGDANSIPSLGMLCVDSDRDSLAKLSIGSNSSNIKVSETLALPLRRSDQYRQKTKLDLSWISRRWIYNVPRSQQTEGLRPLGRLVFVDHFEAICDKVSNCLIDVLRREHIAQSCETFEINPPEAIRPRVVLLTNIAGGLGSGMINDMAYTIRLLLAEQGIKDSEVIGMLMFGNEAVGREVGLATANAFAYLSELRHFADGGYPGDSRLGIPEFEDELPFDHAYGLRLGTEQSSQSDLDRIAEYICLSTTTKCNVFFDANRKKEKQHEEFGFRSFGVSVCGPGLQVQGQEAVERLSKRLIDQWINESREQLFNANGFAAAAFEELELSLEETTKRSIAIVSHLEEWEQGKNMIDNAVVQLGQSGGIPGFATIDKYFDAILDAPNWRQDSVGQSTDLYLAVENEMSIEGQRIGDQVSIKVLELLNSNCISFANTEKAIESCWEQIAGEHESVINGLHSYGTTMRELRQHLELAAANPQNLASDFVSKFIKSYGQIRFQEFALRCCNDQYRVIKSCLTSTKEMVKKFKLQLQVVCDGFNAKELPKRSAKYTPTIQQMLVDSVDENQAEHVKQIESLVLEAIRSDGGQFLDVLSDSLNWQQVLPTTIKEAAQSVLSNAFKKISVDKVISKNNIQPVAMKQWLNELLNEATPFVTDCGGGATLLLGQPSSSSGSAIPKVISDCFDIGLKEIYGTTGDLVLCFEAEQISLANLAFSILKDAPEAVEIAKRIHSRTDVEWTSLDDLI